MKRRLIVGKRYRCSDLVAGLSVLVSEDKTHGILATITIKPKEGIDAKTIESKVAEILANYTVRQKLVFE